MELEDPNKVTRLAYVEVNGENQREIEQGLEREEGEMEEFVAGGKRRNPLNADLLGSGRRVRKRITKKVLTVAHLNIHGVRSKREQLIDFIEEHSPDIMGICETHAEREEDLPKIPNYGWIHSPGTARSAGVALLHERTLRWKKSAS